MPRAPVRVAQRLSSAWTALRGTEMVDLLQGGKVVSVLCAVCGSYGGRGLAVSAQ